MDSISFSVRTLLLGLFAVITVDSSQKLPKNTDLYSMGNEIRTMINNQINEELHASLVYMTMAAHFGRDQINRPGLNKFFLKNSHEEFEHAMKLMEYLISRNGYLEFLNVRMPSKHNWTNVKSALHDSYTLEKEVSEKLMAIHGNATNELKDPHLADMLEADFFREQVESMRKLQGYLSTLRSMGTDEKLAEFMFDQHLLKEH